MADVTHQSYRAAFFRYVEENQPIELTPHGKENTSGIPLFSTSLNEKEKIPKENHERTE